MAHILAIHEEEDSLVLIRRFLCGHGHHVDSFARPGDAAHWLKDNTPDLVVISGGKHGEKARRSLGTLKDAGVSGAIILLLTRTAVPSYILEDLGEQVKMIESSDYEELLQAVNSAVGK